MVAPNLRSRSKRRVYIRTPGGKNKVSYRRRNTSKPTCGSCKSELHGVPRMTTADSQKMAKTKKRAERPYGGNLCSKCMRKTILERIKNDN